MTKSGSVGWSRLRDSRCGCLPWTTIRHQCDLRAQARQGCAGDHGRIWDVLEIAARFGAKVYALQSQQRRPYPARLRLASLKQSAGGGSFEWLTPPRWTASRDAQTGLDPAAGRLPVNSYPQSGDEKAHCRVPCARARLGQGVGRALWRPRSAIRTDVRPPA